MKEISPRPYIHTVFITSFMRDKKKHENKEEYFILISFINFMIIIKKSKMTI